MSTIPKIIHQIWFQGKTAIPQKFLSNVNAIKNFHPTWKYVIWDEKLFFELLSIDNATKNKYAGFKLMHQKIDFMKFVILYYYGGVYIDMDAIVIKPLDPLFDDIKQYDFVASEMPSFGINMKNILSIYDFADKNVPFLNNGVFMSKSFSPILSYLINNTQTKSHAISNSEQILSTTGPTIFSQLVYDYSLLDKNIHILILPFKYFEPCAFNKCTQSDDTYMLHKHQLSWFNSTISSYCNKIMEYDHVMYFVLMFIFGMLIVVIFDKYRCSPY